MEWVELFCTKQGGIQNTHRPVVWNVHTVPHEKSKKNEVTPALLTFSQTSYYLPEPSVLCL